MENKWDKVTYLDNLMSFQNKEENTMKNSRRNIRPIKGTNRHKVICHTREASLESSLKLMTTSNVSRNLGTDTILSPMASR